MAGTQRGSWNEETGEFAPLPSYLEMMMANAAATAFDVEQPRRSFFSRLSPMEKIVAFGILGLGLYGVALVSSGFYLKGKAELSQVLLKRAFAAELRGEDAKPWPWADFTTEAEVSAPRLGKTAIVLSGASGEALAFGPAWLSNTPQPGDEGTSVIAAHRDTHFRWLKDVKPGDDIEIKRRDGTVLTFKTTDARVARWDESGIDAAANGRHLVLTTCWPFDATERGPMRYIVEADLVDTIQTGTVQPGNTKPLSGT
jgi:sortase A